MRVLLVDDHPIVRRALYPLLDVPDIEIAGEAGNGKEAVALTRHVQPDVVLMDVSMPEMDGIEATRAIHAEWPQVCIIGLSVHAEATQAEAMHAAGAMAYLPKTALQETLLAVIRDCHARRRLARPPEATALPQPPFALFLGGLRRGEDSWNVRSLPL
jgi:DNA-binding NarL/FixJ family response regulator